MTQDVRAFNWDSIKTQSTTGANPAAGADPATLTVPAGKKRLYVGFSATLVTAAFAGNRFPRLEIKVDGTNISGIYTANVAHTISVTATYTWCPGVPNSTTLGGYMMSGIAVPGIEVPAGGTVAIVTSAINGADDWSALTYSYKEAPIT